MSVPGIIGIIRDLSRLIELSNTGRAVISVMFPTSCRNIIRILWRSLRA